jgi:UDP-N-acetylglucosamine 2-epimerase (non-hydrolysing)
MNTSIRHLGDAPHPGPAVWLVGGTRPEALKLAPLVTALERQRLIRPVIVSTGQHPSMFHRGLAAFGLCPHRELHPRRDTGSQAELLAQLAEQLDRELVLDPPAAVVVQGDTSSALVGALTAFWRQIPVVHLEAGLRSHDLAAPFPEEANRLMIDQITALYLAPTSLAAANLKSEGINADSIEVIGNTVVDAVLTIAGQNRLFTESSLAAVDTALASGQRLLLVTVHRRESWGEPLRNVLHAVRDVLDAHPGTVAALPAHPNPAVRADVMSVLGADRRVVITPPLDYPDLVRLLERSTLVLSDSGGIQEEAPSFGVPVLVLRDRTERLEAVEAGCALLVGTSRGGIVAAASRLLSADAARRDSVQPRSRAGADGQHWNPFGDGHASERAAVALARLIGLPVCPMAQFVQPEGGVMADRLPRAEADFPVSEWTPVAKENTPSAALVSDGSIR